MPVKINSTKDTFHLTGGNTSYVVHIDSERDLLGLYWGPALNNADITYDEHDYMPGASFDLPASLKPFEIPTPGNGYYGTPALRIRNEYGDDITELKVVSFETYKGKRPLSGLPYIYTENDDEAESVEFTLTDSLTGAEVKAVYTVFNNCGAITRSLKVRNCSEKKLVIEDIMPASLPLWDGDLDILHLKGSWARERSLVRTPAGKSEYRITSERGASGHEENPFFAVLSRNADEDTGKVYSMDLIYSGSFMDSVRSDHQDHLRMGTGMDPDVFSWLLMPGETFVSPEAVLVFSDTGLNGMSAIYHELFRTRLARGKWRDRSSPVLINNWEATYFDFNEQKLIDIAEKAMNIGIELFVLDDGWFGKRNSDDSSLGDWKENRDKLPSGIKGISEKINGMGLMFGLWFEPEMVSPDSRLYREHPDWCLHVDGRKRNEARNQLILDLTRPEVQDYVTGSISEILRSASIGYVKWDMNRNMTEYYSGSLIPERRKETQHRYMLGLYRVLEKITSEFPDILFESCSGGGGRFDPGMLFYMPQTWTSDDTDAVERLKIQYGTSLAYPASSMGAHVSAVPNHQTGRTVSMRMRGEVAMAGNFGFELDLSALSEDDISEAKDLVTRVKEIRDLTRTGRFIRLLSPFDGNDAAWMFVSENRDEALVFFYRTLTTPNTAPVRLLLKGLDPDASYSDSEGRTYSGSVLMNRGLTMRTRNSFSSETVHLKKTDMN
ncbi:MAG: alpha-galactosidase [Christensenellaceae bacterium]|nr:alpha-galactosidase [Christensenellaceae bacterium]